MENKINIAELLKDCPKGMVLDCTMFDDVTLLRVDDREDVTFPIILLREDGNSVILTKYGQCTNANSAKCVIFPKGKTTWEGFVSPCKFKDGDIVYIKTKGHNHNEFIIIFKEIKNDHIHKHVCFAYQVLYTGPSAVGHLVDIEEIRIATEEEKQKLFDAIKANGYKWNAKTKTLEKLIEPIFKVGDRIKWIKTGNIFEIIKILSNCYIAKYLGSDITILFDRQDEYELVLVEPKFKIGDKIKKKDGRDYRLRTIESVNNNYYIIKTPDWFDNCYITDKLPFEYQNEYELAHRNKFDINTLKHFDKVLVRDNDEQEWSTSFFSRCVKSETYKYSCVNDIRWKCCIPYEENKHLADTTNDCDEYYKTW
jgi:hypothetical protein